MADLARIESIIDGVLWMPLRQARILERLAVHLKPKRVLEIGTLHGAGSCYLGAIVSDYGGHVWTVDLPMADHQRNPCAEELLAKCELTNVSVIRRADGAEGWFLDFFRAKEPPLDLVYLDGGHDWKSVAAQLVMAWSALRSGGWLVMDDVQNQKYPDVGTLFDVSGTALSALHYRIGNWGLMMKSRPRDYVPATSSASNEETFRNG